MIPKLNIHFKAVCRNYKCCYLPHLCWTQTPEGILPKARRNDRNQAHVHPCLPARDKQHWKLPAFSHQAPLPHRSSRLLCNDPGFSLEHPSSQEYGACRQDLGFHEWILDTCWSSWMGSRQLWYVYLSFPSHFLRIAPHTSLRQIQRHLLSIPWKKKKKKNTPSTLWPVRVTSMEILLTKSSLNHTIEVTWIQEMITKEALDWSPNSPC